jgi:PAS domain S-box-containing protein
MHLTSSLIFEDIFCNAESTSLLVFDRTGKIEDINFGFQKLLGYPLESLVGKNIAMLYHAEDLDKKYPENLIQSVLETGAAHNDNFLLHQNGDMVWVHSECILAKDKDGQEHLVTIIHDLNNEKTLEEQLRKKNGEQEKIILDHDTFVYTTSHDLRSPLNNLDALIQHLEESQDNPDTVATLIPLLKDSILRLRHKIDELSVVGKRREEENKTSRVNFQAIYEDVLKDLELEISSSGAVVSADFSKVPTIRFSRKNIRSLIQNFVSNALKYRHPERCPVIHIETDAVGRGVILLRIEDNGLGIKDEEKERIFDMYARVHTQVEGTGVGLGIVKKIINSNGGKIEVESEPDAGATFRVYLNAEIPANEELPDETSSFYRKNS